MTATCLALKWVTTDFIVPLTIYTGKQTDEVRSFSSLFFESVRVQIRKYPPCPVTRSYRSKDPSECKGLSRLPPHHVNPGHGKSEGCSASHPLTAVAVTLPLSPPLSDPGSGLTGCTRFRLTPCTPSMQMGTSGLEDTSSCKAWQKLTLAEVSLHLPLY